MNVQVTCDYISIYFMYVWVMIIGWYEFVHLKWFSVKKIINEKKTSSSHNTSLLICLLYFYAGWYANHVWFTTNHMWFYLKLFLIYARFTVICRKSCLLCILNYTIIEERIFLLKQNHEFHSWNACFLRKITCGLHISHMWFPHESHVICMLNLITYFLQITCFFCFLYIL